MSSGCTAMTSIPGRTPSVLPVGPTCGPACPASRTARNSCGVLRCFYPHCPRCDSHGAIVAEWCANTNTDQRRHYLTTASPPLHWLQHEERKQVDNQVLQPPCQRNS